MDKSLKFIAKIGIFFIFFCLCTDIVRLKNTKEILKDSLDLSTKAAALQIDMDMNKISNGIFEIKDGAAQNAFYDLMAKNLNTTKENLIAGTVDCKVINTPGIYINPIDNKTYNINNPTFVAILKFKFTGLLIKEDIIVSNNFAASELVKK